MLTRPIRTWLLPNPFVFLLFFLFVRVQVVGLEPATSWVQEVLVTIGLNPLVPFFFFAFWLFLLTLTCHNFFSGTPIWMPFLPTCSWTGCLQLSFRVRIPGVKLLFCPLTFLLLFFSLLPASFFLSKHSISVKSIRNARNSRYLLEDVSRMIMR